MATIKNFEITANTSEAIDAVEDLNEKIKETTESYKDQQDAAREAAREAAEEARDNAKKIQGIAREGERLLDRMTGGLASAFKRAYVGVKSLTAGMGALKAAIAATGIGLLVVIIGEIAAHWDDIVGYLNSATSEQKQQLKVLEEYVAAQEAALDAISSQENFLRLQGKTEREIRDLKIQQTDETIAALEAQLEGQKQIKKAQIENAERNKQILKAIVAALTLPLGIVLATIDNIGKALGQEFGLAEGLVGGIAGMVFDPEGIAEKADESIDETEKALTRLKSQRDGYLLQNQKDEADAAKKLQDDRDKAAQAEFDALNKENVRIQTAIEAHLANVERLEKESADRRKENRLAIQQFEDDSLNEEFQAVLANLEKKKKAGEKADKEEEDAQKRRSDNRQQIQDLIVGSANSTIQNLMSLNEMYDKNDEVAAKRAFERNKSLQIVQTIINTAGGIMGELNNPTGVISGTNWLKAAVIATTGATQIATISAQQFNGGKASSGGTSPKAPSVPQVSPSFNIVGQSGTNQLLQGIAGQFGQPLRAYVVGSDVTSSQEMERKRIKTATFG